MLIYITRSFSSSLVVIFIVKLGRNVGKNKIKINSKFNIVFNFYKFFNINKEEFLKNNSVFFFFFYKSDKKI